MLNPEQFNHCSKEIEPRHLEDGENADIEAFEHQELIDAFSEVGLPLNYSLASMLAESKNHQGGRRGSGFTQASRFLATVVKSKRSNNDLSIFDGEVAANLDDIAFENDPNFDSREDVDLCALIDVEKFYIIERKIKKPGSLLLLRMIFDICTARSRETSDSQLPSISETSSIGTCTTAELYFYDYFAKKARYRDNYIAKSARMNIFRDEQGEPLFVEKMGLGENHSAISLKEVIINGVHVPAGSLVALQYGPSTSTIETNSKNGNVFQAEVLQGVEFLRFTTLIVNPEQREQTFGTHLAWQIENDIPGASDLSLAEVTKLCKSELSKPETTL